MKKTEADNDRKISRLLTLFNHLALFESTNSIYPVNLLTRIMVKFDSSPPGIGFLA